MPFRCRLQTFHIWRFYSDATFPSSADWCFFTLKHSLLSCRCKHVTSLEILSIYACTWADLSPPINFCFFCSFLHHSYAKIFIHPTSPLLAYNWYRQKSIIKILIFLLVCILTLIFLSPPYWLVAWFVSYCDCVCEFENCRFLLASWKLTHPPSSVRMIPKIDKTYWAYNTVH